jgi:single-strand DNA-binding protein
MNNSINLVGRVVKDPVLKTITGKDVKIAEFSLAVKDYSKKGQQNDAIFFDIKAFNGMTERVMEYITKGRELALHGRVSVEEFTRQNGTHMIKYVVVLNGFHLCSGKAAAEAAPDATDKAEAEGEQSAA